MAVREILKMGDPRLLRVAEPVKEFGTPELEALIADMFDTMHAANGAGLLIGVKAFPSFAAQPLKDKSLQGRGEVLSSLVLVEFHGCIDRHKGIVGAG